MAHAMLRLLATPRISPFFPSRSFAMGLLLKFFNHNGRVVAAKPERVGKTGVHLGFPGASGNIIQVAFGVRMGEIDRGMKRLVLDGKAAGHKFNAARRAQGMT